MKSMNILLILGLYTSLAMSFAAEKKAKAPKLSKSSKVIASVVEADSIMPLGKLPAIMILKNGLKIEILELGQGDASEVGDKLELHYVGKLFGVGTEFDNSYTRSQSFSFVLGSGKVIKGWDLGLVGMLVGEKRKLFVPAELAYGSRNLGVIPPNSSLEFEVELLSKTKGLKPDIFPKHQLFPWQTLRPGIEAHIEVTGEGADAKSGDQIVVHYTGWLMGGTEVHSSVRSGEKGAFTIGAGEVIRGWEQGLIGTKVGEVRYLNLSPMMAFASNPQSRIPPNSRLIYKIRVLEINQIEQESSQDVFPDLGSIKWEGPSGDLQYFEMVKAPKGSPLPTAGNKVAVHYTGWLEDGTMFDSSRRRGAPFEFALGGNQVIRGWDLAIKKMPIGSKRLLKIPAHLGYGNKGAGSIPADATLLFMVEVIRAP